MDDSVPNNNFKIVGGVLVIVILVFLFAKFLNINFSGKNEICPPDKCKIYTVDDNGQPINLPFVQEKGRVRSDFAPNVPPELPKDIPIDPKPLKVISSYEETLASSKTENGHIQITYSYITSQRITIASGNFEQYLKDNGYSVSVGKTEFSQGVYTLFGHKQIGDKISGQFDQSITISIASQNQFENIVSISMIISDINKNQ